MRLAVLGAGYVGLVTSTCLAEIGHSVACIDLDEQKMARLSRGEIPFHERGLSELVMANVQAGRLRFSSRLDAVVADAEAVFIAVGTPTLEADGRADLSQVYAAARSIARLVSSGALIIVKSTVPVGTGDEIERIIRTANPVADFDVVSNPEFLREGAAIDDFMHPDRVVIGVESERARARASAIYAPLKLAPETTLLVSRRSSELTKYAANGFLAIKLSYINEIADFCETVGADIEDVARGVGLDRRIGAAFLRPGPGYGGSCLPKDTLALARSAEDHGIASRMIDATIVVNNSRRRMMVQRIADAAGGDLENKMVAVLGLTFKANTDDLRESPAVDIVRGMLQRGARVRAFDPAGMAERKLLPPDLVCASSAYDAAEKADVLVIATEWPEFRSLDLPRLRRAMNGTVMVDLRNLFSAKAASGSGFIYHGVGRGANGAGVVDRKHAVTRFETAAATS